MLVNCDYVDFVGLGGASKGGGGRVEQPGYRAKVGRSCACRSRSVARLRKRVEPKRQYVCLFSLLPPIKLKRIVPPAGARVLSEVRSCKLE